jgi:hypothetical protein
LQFDRRNRYEGSEQKNKNQVSGLSYANQLWLGFQAPSGPSTQARKAEVMLLRLVE